MSSALLKELCATPGIAGREERVRKLVVKELAPLVDQVRVDAMGNVIATRKGQGVARVMLAAHKDEIGFLVTYVEEGGFSGCDR